MNLLNGQVGFLRWSSATLKSDFWWVFSSTICKLNIKLYFLFKGINVGVFYAVSTLLNQMILYYYKEAQESTGTIGLLIIVSGMFGSVVCGYILDKFHHFK